ncbi:30S ribosomal protein THX [Seonamhaeicola marinus]|uniref:30S ribosomal protein THX n=1 Tax=Seonamhaeicola marinus TaxID=1912246 RepID=A0A5D0H456_9FLAO|nr:30S ribosomal protein THX [Seonamhaeicola marinus]TYA66005.1 30S ribosomal protein THX [Seonamhaeicola marinus]
MGKGDKKSKRGKIWRGTYGVRRLTNKKLRALKKVKQN